MKRTERLKVLACSFQRQILADELDDISRFLNLGNDFRRDQARQTATPLWEGQLRKIRLGAGLGPLLDGILTPTGLSVKFLTAETTKFYNYVHFPAFPSLYLTALFGSSVISSDILLTFYQ